MKEIYVDLGSRSYTIHIENGLRHRFVDYIYPFVKGQRVFILTDEHVHFHYGQDLVAQLSKFFEVGIKILPAGEGTKDFSNLQPIFEDLLAFGLTRSDLIIALGGGVIGDLAGFIAASYLRGIDFVQIPTSLLAQVDSSVGGKVGVDLAQGKNVIGAFYQPKTVLIDPEVLNTLSDHFFHDGMAEVIKYGCIKRLQLFELLERLGNRQAIMEQIEEIIHTCCDIKRKVVEDDERDTGERLKLNYGHTLGHALESATAYQVYSHGQAISIGMVVANQLAIAAGMLQEADAVRIEQLLRAFHLPTNVDKKLIQSALPFISADKKNLENRLNIILVEKIGTSLIYPTSADIYQQL
ncbi:3-dehydroquinate synthase [Streptococcus ruminantium]|uniref:3-dehydroquinate synthase n=1 Tax=Streptococcus ruminantium TaxID=1917441 RepID=UPI0004069937|nr:3-dehydroquinate synthase [Streptococcus ruminantium]MDQ8766836.1 3-dehydroquinate synthase [Streptococcus ruminantium]MDQ8779781.1 3-dehydroquinate synthase [Streptococcus ruminantium]MDQ8837281.1 3-dehydroquinate synthase [Streptococcus ruminantium]